MAPANVAKGSAARGDPRACENARMASSPSESVPQEETPPACRPQLNTAAIREAHRRYVLPAVQTFYDEPMPIVRGQGQHVWDSDGNRYLDFFGGILTVGLGHCHPEVNQAIREQVDTLQHVTTMFPNQPMVELAERLARLSPGGCRKSFFTNSGTEANEMALLIAEMHTGNSEVIALRHGYSGRSRLTMGATGQAPWRLGASTAAGIRHVANAYCYRCPFGLEYPSCDLRCARDIEDVIQTTTSGRIAGFIAEPIQGVGGFITPPPGYFEVAVDIVRRYGGIFICDEVQTGWGRTGGELNGIGHWDVEPDIVTYAKGLGNGVPVGATVATDEVAAAVTGNTLSTFGGNPVSMAAAGAVLEVVERDGLAENAARMGAHLRAGLEELADAHPAIGDVRGKGLMQALEFVADRGTKAPDAAITTCFIQKVRDEGLLIGKGGLYGNCVRISPPLNIGRSDIDDALVILDRALTATETALR
jgi:4-aminobutyrate aminotransferase